MNFNDRGRSKPWPRVGIKIVSQQRADVPSGLSRTNPFLASALRRWSWNALRRSGRADLPSAAGLMVTSSRYLFDLVCGARPVVNQDDFSLR